MKSTIDVEKLLNEDLAASFLCLVGNYFFLFFLFFFLLSWLREGNKPMSKSGNEQMLNIFRIYSQQNNCTGLINLSVGI